MTRAPVVRRETVRVSLLVEHSEATRAALVEAARELFAKQGYAGTATEEIIARARVSRGALYHHFRSKHDLFRAVLEKTEQEFIRRLAEARAPGATMWEQVCNGIQNFLDVSLEPTIHRIVMVDGPAVLGWSTWREIEADYGFGLLQKYLARSMDSGDIERQPIEPLMHLLAGALNEAVMLIAHSPDPTSARKTVGASLARLLEKLGQQATAS